MRVNEKEMIILAQKKGQFEGRLQYREPPGTFRDIGFRERFFRLVGNLLFYFRLTDLGLIDFKEPVGMMILENFSVHIESELDIPFAFAILFFNEPDKRHIFTTRTDSDVISWVNALKQASLQHWKGRLSEMQMKIKSIEFQKEIDAKRRSMEGSLREVNLSHDVQPPFISRPSNSRGNDDGRYYDGRKPQEEAEDSSQDLIQF